jgi:hypothetical protein
VLVCFEEFLSHRDRDIKMVLLGRIRAVVLRAIGAVRVEGAVEIEDVSCWIGTLLEIEITPHGISFFPVSGVTEGNE